MKNKVILLISPEAWGTNFVSKHHYANYLAKHNTVYFLNPVLSSAFSPFGKVKVEINQLKENLFQVNYQNLLPRLNKLPKFIQRSIYSKQAKQIQNKLGINKFDIVWSFDPNRFWDQNIWTSLKTIYHTVDFHPNAKFENEIANSSSIVLGVTPLVIDSVPNHTLKIHRIGHGADIDNFNIDENIKLPGDNKLKACYTGNFHRHIDYDLLIDLAKNNPDLDFILIGPLVDNNLSSGGQIENLKLNELKVLTNVFLIGSVPSNLLMTYISKCDINLVLFKKEYETLHCSPHKLMAYFYSGNITLSNYIDEHEKTDSDIILMEKNLLKIPESLLKITKNIEQYNSQTLINKRKQFAIANTYDSKIEEISKLLFVR